MKKILSAILILSVLASVGFCEIVYSKESGKLIRTEVQTKRVDYSLEYINKRIAYFTTMLAEWNELKTEAGKLGITK